MQLPDFEDALAQFRANRGYIRFGDVSCGTEDQLRELYSREGHSVATLMVPGPEEADLAEREQELANDREVFEKELEAARKEIREARVEVEKARDELAAGQEQLAKEREEFEAEKGNVAATNVQPDPGPDPEEKANEPEGTKPEDAPEPTGEPKAAKPEGGNKAKTQTAGK